MTFKLQWFWTLLLIAGGGSVSVFWTGRCKYRLALRGSVFSTGAIMMVLQVVILLSFQIMAGFMYRQLALIIAFFMTGLAIGAGWISRWWPTVPKAGFAQGIFMWIQVLVCVFPLGLMLILQLMHGESQHFFAPAAISWLFSALSVITGVLGGVHFGAAVSVKAGIGAVVEKIGGELYALDLAGAALGVLFATLFILPLYGIMNTLMVMSGVSGICVLMLMRRS
jgi:spermidine synthase